MSAAADYPNLRPWQPGASPNPGGRPKGESFQAVLRAELEKLHAGKTNRQVIAEKAVSMAVHGNLDAMKWVADRVDGKVPDRIETDIPSPELLDDVLRLEILAYAARQRALARGQE
jgi:Family of unknown function (DUF5681)